MIDLREPSLLWVVPLLTRWRVRESPEEKASEQHPPWALVPALRSCPDVPRGEEGTESLLPKVLSLTLFPARTVL